MRRCSACPSRTSGCGAPRLLALVLTVVVVEFHPLAVMFGFMELPLEALACAIGLACLIIPIMEIYKAIMRAVEKNQ